MTVTLPGPRYPRRMLVAGAACALLAGCTPDSDSTHTAATGTVETAAPPTPTSACAHVPATMACHSVTVSGQQVNYLVSGAPKGKERGAVVLDLGGPGLALFGEGWPGDNLTRVRQKYPSQALLSLEEPWVTADLKPRCEGALSTEFQAQHDGTPLNPATSLAGQCGLFAGKYGWTPTAYTHALTAAAKKEGVTLKAFVGYSFGARRLDYLGSSIAKAILISPSPRNIDASAYLKERTNGVYASWAASAEATPAQVRAAARNWQAFHPRMVSKRSLSVNRADLAAAAAALPYLDEQSRRKLAHYLLEPNLLSDSQLSFVGQAADSSWQRMGTVDVSPARLAYLDEVCPAYTGWPTDRRGELSDPVAVYFQASHRACAESQPVSWRHGSTSAPPTMCIVASRADGVAPPAFAESWARWARIEWRDEPRHADGAWVTDCR